MRGNFQLIWFKLFSWWNLGLWWDLVEITFPHRRDDLCHKNSHIDGVWLFLCKIIDFKIQILFNLLFGCFFELRYILFVRTRKTLVKLDSFSLSLFIFVIVCPEEVLDDCWTSYARSIYALCSRESFWPILSKPSLKSGHIFFCQGCYTKLRPSWIRRNKFLLPLIRTIFNTASIIL